MRKKGSFQLIGVCLLSIVVVFLCSSCGNSQATSSEQTTHSTNLSLSDSLKKADELYAQRSDLSKLREGMNILKSAKMSDADNFDVAWKLSQFCYFLGTHTEDETETKRAFDEGIKFARMALELNNNRPEGHFWLGANLGKRAQLNITKGITDIDEIRNSMKTVLKLDEQYQRSSAYLVLGQLELETGGFLLGGDKKKAVEYLEKGIQLSSDNPLLRLRLAEAYIANNRMDDAKKQTDFILKMQPDQNYLPEYNDAVKETKKLLEKLS